MRFFRPLIVIVCLSLLTGELYGMDILEKQEKALKIIDNFAAKLCTSDEFQTKGNIQEIELSGTAKADLKGVIKKVADLGMQGAGKYQKRKYEGLLQEDLAKTLAKRINCKLEVFNSLKDKLIPTTVAKRAKSKKSEPKIKKDIKSKVVLNNQVPENIVTYRLQSINRWRMYLDKNFDQQTLTNSVEYSEMRPYLSKATIDSIESNNITLRVGRGGNVIKSLVLDDLTALESRELDSIQQHKLAAKEDNRAISSEVYQSSKSNRVESSELKLILRDHNDVLIHDNVVRQISSYNSKHPVYIAYGEPPDCGGPQGNNWMVPTSINVQDYRIYKDGDYWRAKDMVGLEFNIVQLHDNKSGIDNCKWAQLHFVKSEHIISHQDCMGNPRTAILIKSNSTKTAQSQYQIQSPTPLYCACKAEQTFCFLSELECQSNLSDRGCIQKYSSISAFNINDKTKWQTYGAGWVYDNSCVIKERRSQ